jgi:UDP-N-acetylglucosamine--N-acetylmuramyl-(pentapeptide) pyrophosphoryl-undecaprenol N-acetylglucosamine transferase
MEANAAGWAKSLGKALEHSTDPEQFCPRGRAETHASVGKIALRRGQNDGEEQAILPTLWSAAASEKRPQPVILLAAGGTGGHLFPAEALAAALARRGIAVELATDERGGRYGKKFPAGAAHVVASETVRGSNPLALARTLAMLGVGTVQSWRLIGQIKPAAVVGFGGYPTLPPLIAASLRRIPTVIHEQNAVMGRANRLLARRATAIATGFARVLANDASLVAKATRTGNPVRPAVIAAAGSPYEAPQPDGLVRIVVSGGSQGARIMSDIVPTAVERLDVTLRARLLIAQQAREEDLARVREAYAELNLAAEVASFFPDLPERIASAHLVVARAGASTVAELAAIGRPAILVPLPHALDQDQFANAGTLEAAGGAIRLRQEAFTPERLADEISALAASPQRLVTMAAAARHEGALDAAERLADLVMEVAQS